MVAHAHAAPSAGPADGLTRHTLWPHQQAAYQSAVDRSGFMFAIGMGGGKTATTIAILEHDHRERLDEVRRSGNVPFPFRVLVLAPKSVVGVWPDQLREHATSIWHTWAGQVEGAHGRPLKNPSVPRRAEALVQATSDAVKLRRPFMAVVNYEAAHQGDLRKLIEGTRWDAIVLDESHRIKSPGGKASKQAERLGNRCRQRGGRVLALTGTPMPHSPLNLFAQVRALDGGHRLGGNYHKFCQRYGQGEQIWKPGPGGGQQITVYKRLNPDKLAEFTRLVGPLMHQVGEAELDTRLGLPDTIDLHRHVELDPATQRVYSELEKDLISRVGDGVVTAANAMVLVLRLAQAASGYGKDAETGQEIQLSDGALPEKGRLLADVLEDLPVKEPVVVFCRFHHDLDTVRTVAEMQGRVYGELSGRDRAGLTAAGKMSEAVDVLGVQIQSGGVGIDLTRARYGVYYTLGFELANYLQSRKRLHRPGQTRTTTYIHLLAKGTVEHAIYGALAQRREVVDNVLAHLNGARS